MHERLAHDRSAKPSLTTPLKQRSAAAIIAATAALGVLTFASTPSAAQAPADTLRIQVLSGKTGRPVTNARILLWRSVKLDTLDGAKSNPGEFTDGEGYASIPATEAITFFLHVEEHMPCSKDVPAFSLVDIRVHGVVSQNTCSRRIKLYPQVGTLIFFVREETFFERMRH